MPAWQRSAELCSQPFLPEGQVPAAFQGGGHLSHARVAALPLAMYCCTSFSKRYRQLRSDGVVLRGDLGHLGQQAQCKLPVCVPAAGAICHRQRCSDGVVLRSAPSGLGQQDQYQLSMCVLPASALPAVQVIALRSLVL